MTDMAPTPSPDDFPDLAAKMASTPVDLNALPAPLPGEHTDVFAEAEADASRGPSQIHHRRRPAKVEARVDFEAIEERLQHEFGRHAVVSAHSLVAPGSTSVGVEVTFRAMVSLTPPEHIDSPAQHVELFNEEFERMLVDLREVIRDAGTPNAGI